MRYDYNIERDFAMAEDADVGIVIWNIRGDGYA